MSCGLFCILKICPLWQGFYQGEKGKKTRDGIMKKRNRLLERGFQGVEVASIIRNKDEGLLV